MSRPIGLGAKSENSNFDLKPLEEKNKGLQVKIDKLCKENKAIKRENTLLKKEMEREKTKISVQTGRTE